MRKKPTWIILILIAGLIAGGGYYLLMGQSSTGSVAATTYSETIEVRRGDITARISPIGEVYPVRSASLSFKGSGGTLIELNVAAGETVEAGEVLARIDPAALLRAVDSAEADLLSAQEELELALQPYSELDLQKLRLAVSQAELNLEQAAQAREDLLNPDVAKARRAVRDAEYELRMAEYNLEGARIATGVTKTIRDLEYALDWHERNVRDIAAGYVPITRRGQEPMTLEGAQAALEEARADLDRARLNASLSLSSAEDRVTTAKKALADARENLEEALAGPDAAVLASADNTVTQAELRLARAQADLETALAGGKSRTLELAQARCAAARATLQSAQESLAGATLRAPFDGVIISVNARAGDQVGPNRVILTMADLTELRVRAFVDETQITSVLEGQPAAITFDALPGQSFAGVVLEVPVEGALSGNVVTYHVVISLENAGGAALKPGMTANISLATGQAKDVLLLPAYAVLRTTEGSVVNLLEESSGAVVSSRVETGLSDGTYVQIVRGLNEGDVVEAQYSAGSTTTDGFFGGGGITGITGGFFGGTGRR